MKKIFILISFCLPLLSTSIGSAQIKTFGIVPNRLFVDEDSKVLFAVESPNTPSNQTITLVELDESGTKVKFRWQLTDDGTQRDWKSGDHIFSRRIQFKEKRPRTLIFRVVDESAESLPADSQTPPTVPTNQQATLVIEARPTMIDILKDVYRKMKEKF